MSPGSYGPGSVEAPGPPSSPEGTLGHRGLTAPAPLKREHALSLLDAEVVTGVLRPRLR